MGEPGGRTPTPAERRQEILEVALRAVKRCQVRYGGKQELATEGSEEVQELLTRVELVLGHGMKEAGGAPSLGLAMMRNVKDIVSQKDFSPCDIGGVWRLVRTVLNKHQYQRYLLLPGLTTDGGRARAWLRSVMNEQSLERHLQMVLGDQGRLGQFYEDWAFLRDEERASMLPAMAAGLTSIRFALKVDNPDLNTDSGDTLPSLSSLSTLLPSSLKPSNQSSDPGIAVEAEEPHAVISTKPRIRKKKKPRALAQIVSFPETSGAAEEAVEVFSETPPPASLVPPLASVSCSTPAEVQASLDALLGLRVETAPQPSTSPGEAFTIDYMAARLDRVEVEQKGNLTGGIYEGGGVLGDREVQERKEDREERSLSALTPVNNMSVGALFPVTPHNASVSDDGALDGEEEGSAPYTTIPDYALGHLRPPEQASLGRSSLASGASGGSGGSGRSTLGREDLKQALLSVMEKKDEVEEQAKGLKALLDQELATTEQLRQEVAEVRSQGRDNIEKLEARNSILARENELLKHQLKKYVGAVQKLRDGPQAHETLAKLEGPKAGEANSKYIDYHYEASEYEKKLIQVAEMHGELLEFNETLQKTVQTKEAVLVRLREELVRVRGPLPGEADHSASIGSQDNLSIGGRTFVNIWVPSVFLTGSGASRHHVYQVYIRIRDTEWNVYRRYSQFHELNQTLRKKDPIVNSFDFPPKKSMGNMEERFVEDRRKALQSYLRCIVNFLVTTDVSLSTSPDKTTLLTLLPFFADPSPTTSNGASSGRSLFSRRRRPDPPAGQPNIVL